MSRRVKVTKILKKVPRIFHRLDLRLEYLHENKSPHREAHDFTWLQIFVFPPHYPPLTRKSNPPGIGVTHRIQRRAGVGPKVIKLSQVFRSNLFRHSMKAMSMYQFVYTCFFSTWIFQNMWNFCLLVGVPDKMVEILHTKGRSRYFTHEFGRTRYPVSTCFGSTKGFAGFRYRF